MRISDWSSDVCSSDLQIAPVVGLGEGRDAPDAAGLVDLWRLGVGAAFAGLDHADEAVARQRRVEHGQIARFEDVQWKTAPGQQQNALQRDNRQDPRQVRSEERRVGKECVRTCRSGCLTYL